MRRLSCVDPDPARRTPMPKAKRRTRRAAWRAPSPRRGGGAAAASWRRRRHYRRRAAAAAASTVSRCWWATRAAPPQSARARGAAACFLPRAQDRATCARALRRCALQEWPWRRAARRRDAVPLAPRRQQWGYQHHQSAQLGAVSAGGGDSSRVSARFADQQAAVACWECGPGRCSCAADTDDSAMGI